MHYRFERELFRFEDYGKEENIDRLKNESIQDAIRSLVNRLGGKSSIKRTLLNGIEVLQEYSSVDELDETIVPPPQKFTTLVFNV